MHFKSTFKVFKKYLYHILKLLKHSRRMLLEFFEHILKKFLFDFNSIFITLLKKSNFIFGSELGNVQRILKIFKNYDDYNLQDSSL